MWQLLGTGKSTVALQEAHNVTSTPKGRKCSKCGKTKALDCFSYEDRDECKWCVNEYRVALNTSTQSQADRSGCDWTNEEDETIKVMTADGFTDTSMARVLKRSLSSVRTRRCRILGLNKRAKAAPKVIYNSFEWHVRCEIKRITVEARASTSTITVWCGIHTPWPNIRKAFIAVGLTTDDFSVWRIGATAGA